VAAAGSADPGRLMRRPLRVACGEGALELIEVQLEGRKRVTAEDFANGQRIAENDILGES
jgi:methionyl-tRNA formyltransferase